jgi:hypothetical protein
MDPEFSLCVAVCVLPLRCDQKPHGHNGEKQEVTLPIGDAIINSE